MKVIDGIPTRLYGIRKGAVCVVEFIQKCCRCGLEHDVRIEHHDKSAEMDITFQRIDSVDK